MQIDLDSSELETLVMALICFEHRIARGPYPPGDLVPLDREEREALAERLMTALRRA